jgi:hypothetical protein
VSGSVAESVEASKARLGPARALELARKADRVIAIRGKRVVEFDMMANPPDDETLLAHLLGPTGNLRAPTAMVGRTLVVGFNEETYKQVLGA